MGFALVFVKEHGHQHQHQHQHRWASAQARAYDMALDEAQMQVSWLEQDSKMRSRDPRRGHGSQKQNHGRAVEKPLIVYSSGAGHSY